MATTNAQLSGIHSTSYSTRNGLSNPAIKSIVKDEDGFLWIGTSEGLNRFDGDRFTVLLRQNNKPSLTDNGISLLKYIGGNQLLACTNNGLNIINTRTLSVKNKFLTTTNEEDKANFVLSALKDAEGNIIVATLKHVFKLNSNFETIDSISCNNAFAKQYGKLGTNPYLFSYSNGQKWAVFFLNLHCFFTVDFKTHSLKKEPLLPVLDDNENAASVSSSINNDIILVGRKISVTGLSYSRIKIYNTKSGSIEEHQFEFEKYGNVFSNAAYLNDSMVLINRYFGTPYIFNRNSNVLTQPKELFNWFTSDPDGIMCSLYNDGKYLWAGTSKELLKISSAPLAFTRLKGIDSFLASPSLVQINNLVRDKNKFYITGMGAGYFAYDFINKTSESNAPLNAKYGGVTISALNCPIDKDNIWFSSFYGLKTYNRRTHLISIVPVEGKPADLDSSVTASAVASNGDLWLASNKTVSVYHAAEKRFTFFIKGKTFPEGYIAEIAAGTNADMFIAVRNPNALIKWDHRSGKFITLEKEFVYKDYKLEYINTLCADKKNGLYIAGKGSLVYYNLSTGKYDVYFKNDGLSTTRIRSMCVDNKGLVWIATANGLNCFNPALKKFTTYYTDDGLPDDNMYGVGMADTSSNLMWVGSSKDFRLFEPDKLLGENKAPKILVTSFRINGNDDYFTGDLTKLKYTQNNINIEFAGINFDNGNLNIYEYKLEGWDETWKNSEGQKFAGYTNLPAGKYTFKVKAANRQGVWTDNPAEISFRIRPPFWKTWWFYFLFAVFFITSIFYLFKLQAKRGKQREKEKLKINDEINELRMRALRSQLNPHFIFNALNSIQYFVMDNNTIEASKYLSKFAKLFRLVLDNSEASLVPLQKEIDLLTYYIELEALRFNNNFTFSIDTDDALSKENNLIPPMMLQPHIENAILHGLSMKKSGGHIQLRFKKKDEKTLQCEIEDNGIGRKAAAIIKSEKFQTHESKGLKIIDKRMELVSIQYQVKAFYETEDLYDAGNIVGGTKVTVTLPLLNNNTNESNNR